MLGRIPVQQIAADDERLICLEPVHNGFGQISAFGEFAANIKRLALRKPREQFLLNTLLVPIRQRRVNRYRQPENRLVGINFGCIGSAVDFDKTDGEYVLADASVRVRAGKILSATQMSRLRCNEFVFCDSYPQLLERWNWDVDAEFRISIKKPGLQGLRP